MALLFFPNHAWRLFDDTFDFRVIRTPREAIIQFAEKFGQDMKIGDRMMRIAFREVVASPGSVERLALVETATLKLEMHGPVGETIVGFTYIIDDVGYTQYLEAHGIAR